jgi:hypothetical protein
MGFRPVLEFDEPVPTNIFSPSQATWMAVRWAYYGGISPDLLISTVDEPHSHPSKHCGNV